MHNRDRRRWWRPTVRTRIVAAITLVSAVALATVGASAYFVERARILESIDARLGANLVSARHLVAEGNNGSGVWPSAEQALAEVVQRMSPDDKTGALGIIDARAALVPGVPLEVDLRSVPEFTPFVAAEAADGEPVIGTFAESGVVWRYLAAPIEIGDNAPQRVVFAMAYDVEGELAEINDAAGAYLIASALALVAITAVATIVSTRLLRPLRRMRETAERVSGQSLSERLPVEGRDDVSDLAATMNDMLDRLDATLDGQRQLLSDVGHELKTPLTIVRGHLEVMDPADPVDVADSRALAIDELERMAKLVKDLGAAATLHGAAPVARREVDAGDLLRTVARKLVAIGGAEVRVRTVADVVASLDPDRITQALIQLTQNAVTHGAGPIELSSEVDGNALIFSVRDHGAGVPDDAKAGIFDRFHRDGERGGSGLGLNIVQVIARAHGGSATVSDAEGGGALFTVTLPGAVTSNSVVDAHGLAIPPRPPLPVLVEPVLVEKE